MAKYLNFLIMLGLTLNLTLAKATETQTQNILNNGSFTNETNGWELDGTASYDGNNYGNINKSVRFSGVEGGSVTQIIVLGNISTENKEVTTISGSLISIGCNNEGSSWCTKTGTANNLDPVNITMTLSDGTNTEVLNHNFTSDYNDGVITTNYSVDVTESFATNNTSLTINYFGADTGNKTGQFGSIIDDLSLILTLNDIQIPEITEIPDIQEIQPVIEPESIIGGLDASSIVDTLSTGVIDINTSAEMQMASISSPISVIPSIRSQEMHNDMADINTNNEISIQPDMPDIEMPDIEMPEIDMPEPIQEINLESEIKEIEENEQQTEESSQNAKDDSQNDTSDISESSAEEENKEPEEEVSDKSEKEVVVKNINNNQKSVKTAKTTKSNKKKSSEQPKTDAKKTDVDKPSTNVKSTIEIKALDLPTIISFNKEYFANIYKDTIDLTTTEVDFYEQDGFNTDYAKASADFFGEYSNTNSQWDLVVKPDVFRIKPFTRSR